MRRWERRGCGIHFGFLFAFHILSVSCRLMSLQTQSCQEVEDHISSVRTKILKSGLPKLT